MISTPDKSVPVKQTLALIAGGFAFIVLSSFASYSFFNSQKDLKDDNAGRVTASSIVVESPFTQVKTESEFLGVLSAFLNIIEPNPEGYPPMYLSGFGLNSPNGLHTFLDEAKHYPLPRIMRTQLDSSSAFTAYEQATDYYRTHHKPKYSPISKSEIDDFNQSMIEALKRLPDGTGYMVLSVVDAYRELVVGSPKFIGSYAKSPRHLPSMEALEGMSVFKDLRGKYGQSGKVDFVIGESLSSALGALAALVTYDSDKRTDSQYELAFEFIDRLHEIQPEEAGRVQLSQLLFTRSYDHAVSYLHQLRERQGVKLHDTNKGLLIYRIMESLANQEAPEASLTLAIKTAEYWSSLDPDFVHRTNTFKMLDNSDYRTSTKQMFMARTPEFMVYVARLGVIKAQANVRAARLSLKLLKQEFDRKADANLGAAEENRADLLGSKDNEKIEMTE